MPVEQWTKMQSVAEDPTLEEAVFTFPPNAIIVIDESQKVFRPRAATSKVPPHVAAMETHRHGGVDFWLLTQHPSLLDGNIRRLVTKHLHIHDTFMGRRLLEWAECRDPKSKTDRADAISLSYSPPKSSFALYHSAEVHTKLERKTPKAFYILIAALVLLVGFAVFGYGRYQKRFNEKPTLPVPEDKPLLSSVATPILQPAASVDVDYREQFLPVHPNFPESAPAYESLRVVKDFPRIAGCIKLADVCRCYSQQGSKLDVLPERCGEIVAGGYFDPYREPHQVKDTAPQVVQVMKSSQDQAALSDSL